MTIASQCFHYDVSRCASSARTAAISAVNVPKSLPRCASTARRRDTCPGTVSRSRQGNSGCVYQQSSAASYSFSPHRPCYNCQVRGHVARDCTKAESRGSGTRGRGMRGRGFGGRGHSHGGGVARPPQAPRHTGTGANTLPLGSRAKSDATGGGLGTLGKRGGKR